jgi:serine/threonine protein kinase
VERFKVIVIPQAVDDKFIIKKISIKDQTKVISRKDIALYPEDLQKTIFEGCRIAKRLNANHQRGYAHGDMKPDNILIDEQGQFFIINLESSTPIGEIHLHCGDPKFEAFEIKNSKQ